MTEPTRFHSPYAHWVSGLAVEVLAVVGFMFLMSAMAWIVSVVR